MKRRPSPWAVWGLFVVVSVVAGALKIVYGRGPDRSSGSVGVSMLLAFGVFATVGAIIVSRRPLHAIGWIYLLGALAAAVGTLASSLVDVDLATAGRPPGFRFVYWLDALLQDVPLVVLIPLPLLLFPHGTLRSRTWRAMFWVAVGCIVLIGARSFVPDRFDQPGAPANPLGIPGAKRILESLGVNATAVLGLIGLAAIVSLFVRFHRATGAERQQLKWLGWAGVWTIVLLFMAGPGTFSGLLPMAVVRITMPLVPYLFAMAIAVIPLFTAVAILRYRLYDIDRIVSRTVSYALITAILGGTFAIVVLVATTLVGSRARTPDWLIAGATLAVAALFRPVRRRVQDAVDRRFNRSRYNAARTITAFSARLRDEIDVDALGAELGEVVGRTMQPAHVSLWLRTR